MDCICLLYNAREDVILVCSEQMLYPSFFVSFGTFSLSIIHFCRLKNEENYYQLIS